MLHDFDQGKWSEDGKTLLPPRTDEGLEEDDLAGLDAYYQGFSHALSRDKDSRRAGKILREGCGQLSMFVPEEDAWTTCFLRIDEEGGGLQFYENEAQYEREKLKKEQGCALPHLSLQVCRYITYNFLEAIPLPFVCSNMHVFTPMFAPIDTNNLS